MHARSIAMLDGWTDEEFEVLRSPWLLWGHFALTCVLFVVAGVCQWLRSGPEVPNSVGFFHPFTSDGGGGERVLWCAVREIQRARPDCQCVIYTGDDATGEELARRAKERFGVELRAVPGVVKLRWRGLVVPERYPVLTMVGQAIGGALLTAEAVTSYRPTVFFDTVGHAFGYPVAKLAGCVVACYVHYPTISSDMIARVASRADTYNNRSIVAHSWLLSVLKLAYYKSFAVVYGACGRYAACVAANSSWTAAHLRRLWRVDRVRVVYPPCNVAGLTDFSLSDRSGGGRGDIQGGVQGGVQGGRGVKGVEGIEGVERVDGGDGSGEGPYLVSVGQFRPEKDHALQLRAWAKMRADERDADTPSVPSDARLKIVGGCRGEADKRRLDALRATAKDLGVDDSVEFHVDVPYARLRELLGGAAAGVHTMLDEHFGICVVEYMAAGAVPIAHDSAGPAMDIVVPAVRPEASEGDEGPPNDASGDDVRLPVGFLATTVDGYADAMWAALSMTEDERVTMATLARARADVFSERAFNGAFIDAMAPALASLALDRRDAILEAAGVRTRGPRGAASPAGGPRRRRG